jgi:hypothetical protein
MRFVRSLVAVGALGALVAFVPRAAEAQPDRAFENAWFWGAKAGVMQFWTPSVSHAPAPMFGLDMLITRRRAALNVSYDMGFFDETSTYPEYDAAGVSTGTTGVARIEDIRRFQATLLAFPKRFGGLRPYAGVGLGVNVVRRATSLSGNPAADAQTSIEDVRSRGAIHFTGGLMGQYRRVSLFGQATLMPARNRSFFNNAETIFVEGGVRYNIGSSRDRN